jgi:predicted transcriptional regulator
LDIQLTELMRDQFGIVVVIDSGLSGDLPETSKRRYDAGTKVLKIARWLMPGQRAFQFATQLALLSQSDVISAIVATDHELSTESRGVARVGLANYFAGAFLLPIANSIRPQRNCAMTSTCWGAASRSASRPSATGFPHCSVRRNAGCRSSSCVPTRPETSQSASRPPHFISAGWAAAVRCGWCTMRSPNRAGSPGRWRKCLAVGLGCDLAYADKLIYSTGVVLDDPTTAVPIGAGCKICNRQACAQRPFPYLGGRVVVDENAGSSLPYSSTGQPD